jgi:hypothetical protein
VSARVTFLPAAATTRVPFAELGRASFGAWGIVDDAAWPAADAGDALELLFLSPAEYRYAMRGLDLADVADAVAQRRQRFSSELPAKAMGLLAEPARRCVRAVDGDAAAVSLRVELLDALASFTVLSRFAGTAPLAMLDYVRQGDAEIAAEIASPSLQVAGSPPPASDEQSTRVRFARALGELAARRGRPEKALAIPYFDVARVYLVSPPTPALELRARVLGDPVKRWRDGLLLPVPERELATLATEHRLSVVYPAQGPFVAALSELSPAQLEVELGERSMAPDFSDYLDARRLQQATLRAAAYLLASSDEGIAAALAEQSAEEARKLGGWLARGAPPSPPAAVRAELGEVVRTSALLVALCRKQGANAAAAKVEAFGRALSHIVKEI